MEQFETEQNLRSSRGARIDAGALLDLAARSPAKADTVASWGDHSAWPSSMIKVACFDSSLVFYGMIRILDHLFARVEVASVRSIADLIAAAEAGEHFDLVILDAGPSDSEDFEGLRRAVAALPGVPFIVTSLDEAPSNISAALEAGARGFISKAAKIDVLRFALPLVLMGEFYVPPSLYLSGAGGGWAPGSARGAALDAPAAKLTARQIDVLMMLAKGASNKQIARNLGLFEGTVKLHVKALLRKLGARNRAQAVLAGVRAGYLKNELLGA